MFVEGLVSTIIPVHNRSGLLREAVFSVLAQTYRPIEVIVVDDGSTDETGDVAAALAKEYSEVRVMHRENGGPGAARETGRSVARGEFIQYLDSDDLLLPEKFRMQIVGLRQNSDCTVSYGKTRFHLAEEILPNLPWKRTGEYIPTMFPSFLQSRWWGTSTPLYRREVIDSIGPWTTLKNEEDWEYDCRVASKGGRLHYCNAFVSTERGGIGHHLSSDGATDPRKLKDRAIAHTLILKHAKVAGVSYEVSEMRHFIRELFLLSRQCGAAHLEIESEMLFCLARAETVSANQGIWDFRLYRFAATLLGWHLAGRLACHLDGLRV